jgi:hypothetical protein
VVQGHLAYYAVPGDTDAVASFRTQVTRHCFKGATAPQPARTRDLATDEPPRNSMATASPRQAARPRPALRRQNPRQEPSEVMPESAKGTRTATDRP